MINTAKFILVFGGFNSNGISKNSYDKGLLGELYLMDLMYIDDIKNIDYQSSQYESDGSSDVKIEESKKKNEVKIADKNKSILRKIDIKRLDDRPIPSCGGKFFRTKNITCILLGWNEKFAQKKT